jgi:hypothetical protein
VAELLEAESQLGGSELEQQGFAWIWRLTISAG